MSDRPGVPTVATKDSAVHAQTMVGASASKALAVDSLLNGRYRVLSQVGEGGMGVVYRVSDALHPDRAVALKTLHSSTLKAEQVGWFKSEFRIMAGLRHPNVASVWDFEPLQGTADYFFTMEYIEGRDLMSFSRGLLPERVIALFVDVCRALAYLHSRRIVHRDLKPANVLVDAAGHVKVLDFGLTSAGGRRLIGTPTYMAPELSLGEGAGDPRVDLYSLGIMLYEVLVGRPPFQATKLLDLLRKHKSEAIEFPAALSEWLRTIIETLTAKEPSKRYRSANGVIEDINRKGGFSYPLETAETKESYIASGRLVGRERERERLLEWLWKRTGEGSDRAVPAFFVSGVSGVGKSRLVREARHQAQLAGLAFVEGDCYEASVDEFAPVVEVLRHACSLAEAADATDLVERHAEVLATLDAQTTAESRGMTAGEAQNARRALFERASEFLARVGERVPYVVHFEDLQWARPGTSELLGDLVRQVAMRETSGGRARVAIVGSFRSDEVEGRPIEKLLAGVGERGEGEVLPLLPLEQGEVHGLIGSMLGIDSLPEEFVARVAQETAGNPFFIKEVMRALVERGDVFLLEGAWAATKSVGELEIPASMAAVFRRRAALLDARSRVAIELIAVYGQPMEAAILAACMDLEVEEVASALRDLVQRQMLERLADSGAVRIAHDRMRETLYADMGEEKRKALHAAIARTLERERPDSIYEIAHHAWRSGQREMARRYALEAGRKAQAAYASDLAVEHFEHALGLLDSEEKAGVLGRDIAERLADLDCLIGRHSDSLAHYRSLLETLSAPRERARLLRKIAQLYVQKGELKEAPAPAWAAVELLGETPAGSSIGIVPATFVEIARHLFSRFVRPAALVRSEDERERLRELSHAYRLLAEAYFFVDQRRTLMPMLAASNAAERVGPSPELCRMLAGVAFAYAYFGMAGSARRLIDRAMAMADSLDAPLAIATTSAMGAIVYNNVPDYPRAVALARRAIDLTRKHGDMFTLGMAGISLSNALRVSGRLQQARDEALEIWHVLDRTDAQTHGKGVLTHVVLLEVELGDHAAEAHADQCVAMGERAGDHATLVQALYALARVREEQSRREEALVILRRVRDLMLEQRVRSYLVGEIAHAVARTLLWRQVEGVERVDRAARREAVAMVARALSQTKRTMRGRPSALTAAALLAWASGRRRSAERLFAAGVRMAEEQGTELLLANACFERGRVLALSGEAVSSGRSLSRALDIYRRIAAAPAAARTQRWLEKVG